MTGRDELRRLVRDELDKRQPFELAVVESVRDDGTVNLSWGTQVLNGVPCNRSYSPRAEGDTVLLARWRGGMRVIDRVGAPPPPPSGAKITWGNAAPNGAGWEQAASVWVREGEVFAQLASGAPPPRDTSTIQPSSQGAWRDGFLDSGQDPTQGAWPTYPHPYTGAWFYGNQLVGLTGVSTITMRLARSTSHSGVNGGVRPRLYLLSASGAGSRTPALGTGPVSGPALGLGASGVFTLSASWRDALLSGAAKGIGVYAPVGSSYLVFTGSCGQLTIT